MKITELLDVKSINLNVDVKTKDEAIDHMVGLMAASGKISDKAAYKKGILAREALTSTGIGEGIAIPHAQVAAVKTAGLAAMTLKAGVDYDSLDGRPVHLCFMIAAPEDGGNTHLQALAKLSALLMNEDFRKKLMNAKNENEFLGIIDEEEAKKDAEAAAQSTDASQGYKVLAVTACPTGIAHTFMAAENLTKAGQALGYPLKAETNGADGVGNALTAQEIADCDGIIIAADKNVEMARFDGKPVLSVSVTKGIRDSETLIKKIMNKEVPVYHASEGEVKAAAADKEGAGHTIYKHLMNGVSHMLPFVIGGGILIAIAFLLDKQVASNMSNFGMNTPVAAFFKTVGGYAFNMMLPVLAGYIAMSIADRPGLAVGFVGGLVASNGLTLTNAMTVASKGGVSAGFLGALFAGFAGGYLVLGLKKVFSHLPNALEGIKPVLLYPVCGILLVALLTAFVDPFIAMINTGLNGWLTGMGTTSSVVLGMICGGMMSIDMGGPFNKASYVFATSQLANGNYTLMAAVMAGGMVPPLVIALSTTFFKNKWTKEERDSGLVNYVMGLSFISEGAIPFAANDPLRVLPSCIVGSAIAGGLSMAFNCSLRAPHGGIFVIGLIGNPLMYIVAIAAGSAVGAVILSALKKKVSE